MNRPRPIDAQGMHPHSLQALQAQWDEEARLRRALGRARQAMRLFRLTRGDLVWSLYWAALTFLCLWVSA